MRGLALLLVVLASCTPSAPPPASLAPAPSDTVAPPPSAVPIASTSASTPPSPPPPVLTASATASAEPLADDKCVKAGSCENGLACAPGFRCSGLPAYRCYRGPCAMPKCLPRGARIATPSGDVDAEAITQGMLVWTMAADGRRVAAPVLRTSRVPVLGPHAMVRLRLADGRTVEASPEHPMAGGGPLAGVVAGTPYDGARVVTVERVAYDGAFTVDLLPAGETGVYWADGVPLGSTLR
jgi:hypothetical protein